MFVVSPGRGGVAKSRCTVTGTAVPLAALPAPEPPAARNAYAPTVEARTPTTARTAMPRFVARLGITTGEIQRLTRQTWATTLARTLRLTVHELAIGDSYLCHASIGARTANGQSSEALRPRRLQDLRTGFLTLISASNRVTRHRLQASLPRVPRPRLFQRHRAALCEPRPARRLSESRSQQLS